jgi:cysteine desulfurase
MIYLDNSATTQLHPEVLEAMMPWLRDRFGNASSAHLYGRQARVAVEQAREEIAAAMNAHPAEFIFTGGGTESNNTVIKSCTGESALADRIACSSVEHHAVLEPAEDCARRGISVRSIGVDTLGNIHTHELAECNAPRTLVSVMHVNNETGYVFELASLRGMVPDALFHTDAVQSFTKIPLDVAALGVDFVSVSAHKIHGPQGIGGLFIRKGIDFKAHQHGGGQERNRRAGTESLPLIVGFQHAVRIALRDAEQTTAHCRELVALMRSGIQERIPQIRWNTPEHAAPHILNVSFTDAAQLDGDAILQLLDLRGIACSNGSACVSGTMQPSHVLLAMGRETAESRAAVRFSVCRTTTTHDVLEAVDALSHIMQELRSA